MLLLYKNAESSSILLANVGTGRDVKSRITFDLESMNLRKR